MPIFGIDISHYQGEFDVGRAAREGIEFFIFKATEGSGFTDPRFADNVSKARATGKAFAAYHYQRAEASAAAQVAHIARVVPRDVAVIPDVEAESGSVALTRKIIAGLRRAGYRVPLLYLPRWYWQRIGSPSLSGLPPLWSSRYPDKRVGDIRDEYADVPEHYWHGYGGLAVAVLQFTSSARVAGHAPVDGNAYRGTLAQLRALFGTASDYGDDMILCRSGGSSDERDNAFVPIPVNPHRAHVLVVAPDRGHQVHVRFANTWTNTREKGMGSLEPEELSGAGSYSVHPNQGWVLDVPKGVTKVDFGYWSEAEFYVGLFPI